MASTLSSPPVLTDELLVRCHERAPRYDREHAFCAEDLEELRDAGFTCLPLPAHYGGRGMPLAAALQELRRLAYYAPATAHALTMHIAWCGVASERWQQGDRAMGWILDEAAAGHVFAAGYAEPGHDVPILASTTRAERVDGGYRFTGHKVFGSLTPAWSYLALHGVAHDAAGGARFVHAFMPRHTEGYATRESRDALGLRAARSDDTILDGAFIPDRFIVRVVPGCGAACDPVASALLAWSTLGYASVMLGLARRALDLSIDTVARSRSAERARPSMRLQGGRAGIAAMGMEYEAIEPLLDHVAEHWSSGATHGERWPMKLLVANQHVVDGAWRIVDSALELSGSGGVLRRGEIERLFRDARVARAHCDHARYTRELVARTLAGEEVAESSS